MKKIYTVIIATFILGLQSCSDFLSTVPNGEVIVSKTSDFRDLMASYLLPITTINPTSDMVKISFGNSVFPPLTSPAGTLGVYTGEIILTKHEGYFDKNTNQLTTTGKNISTWKASSWNMWSRYYVFIGNLNFIISDIETVDNPDINMQNYVQGEALVWRAYSFFKLLQYYSPYKSNELGIPINLDPVKDLGTLKPKRKTQREVYDQIIDDCERALKLIDKTNTTSWNFAYRRDFIQSMLASVYTYKAMSGASDGDSDWTNAEKYANLAIKGRNLIATSNDLKALFACGNTGVTAAIKGYRSDEYYIRIMGGSNSNASYVTLNTAYVYDIKIPTTMCGENANPAYYALYADEDIRKRAYYQNEQTADKYSFNQFPPVLAGAGNSYGIFMPFRLAEAYLIKAEALARLGKLGEAENVLKEFQTSRYTIVPDIPLGQEELINAIIKERKLEFFQEVDIVWLDMKRLGEKVERIVDGEPHTLEPDDFRYTFPIPSSEITNNTNISQNPGWENLIDY